MNFSKHGPSNMRLVFTCPATNYLAQCVAAERAGYEQHQRMQALVDAGKAEWGPDGSELFLCSDVAE